MNGSFDNFDLDDIPIFVDGLTDFLSDRTDNQKSFAGVSYYLDSIDTKTAITKLFIASEKIISSRR